jgi:molybdopterin/thiamine biosynthesis adenylyltransferase
MLSDDELTTYKWQIWTPGFGVAGQEKLKSATVLISRIGGVGGSLAQQLAAAGVGKLTLAHAGNSRANDLNRQILMSHARLGQPRVEQAADKLRELNPRLQIELVPENITPDNARDLVAKADLVASCAPLFSERLAMNDAAVALGKPFVDCAMFDMELQVLSVMPGGPCLRCLYPESPAAWKREFPVFGAVAGAAGCLGAVEAIKLLAKLGEPLTDRMLLADLGTMSFRRLPRQRDPNCPACGDAKSRLNSSGLLADS